jgi:hypothetical protein
MGDRCYWCDREDVELHAPEGARLVGSPPLELPRRMTERERLLFVLCLECMVVFAELRYRHNGELMEAHRA